MLNSSPDLTGNRIAAPKIVRAEDFAKACDGLLEFNDKGEVIYKTCFAAGTLVHTQDGLVPIEKLQVGTPVLTQPEQGGERTYRRVLNKVSHLDQAVYAVQVRTLADDTLTTLIATGTHPFWVSEPLAAEEHWLAAACLQAGMTLQLANGAAAAVEAVAPLRHTQYPQWGLATDEQSGQAMLFDLTGASPQLIEPSQAAALSTDHTWHLGELYQTTVYNFEVDECHTYYVGEQGVWVHNNNCTGEEALSGAADKTQHTCFPEDTVVHAANGIYYEIKYVNVGDMVLSRCPRTGQQGYRRVTKVFEHLDKPVQTWIRYQYDCQPDDDLWGTPYYDEKMFKNTLRVTPEHPIWVNGKGWVPAAEIQDGDTLEIIDPYPRDDDYRPEGRKRLQLALSGERWQATVTAVDTFDESQLMLERTNGRVLRVEPVYNLEVEEFHTYFVDYPGVWVHNCNPEPGIERTPLERSTPNDEVLG